MIEYLSYMLSTEQLVRERFGQQGPSMADTLLGDQRKAANSRRRLQSAVQPKSRKRRTWTGRNRDAA